MSPYEIFDEEEIKLMENVGHIKNKIYTKEDMNKLSNSVVEEIMSKSCKNGDMDKYSNQFSAIVDRMEHYMKI